MTLTIEGISGDTLSTVGTTGVSLLKMLRTYFRTASNSESQP